MLDVAELDESLKIKSIGRLAGSKHPYIRLLSLNSNFEKFFSPGTRVGIDPFHRTSIELLKKLRDLVWANKAIERNRLILEAVKRTDISTILSREGNRLLLAKGQRQD